MELVWTITGIALLIAGFIGCIAPGVPGPPVAYLALLVRQFLIQEVYTTDFLVIVALFVTIVTVMDFVIPVWGTKKFGGSPYGTWGATIGLVIGILFAPFGLVSIFIGPFLGAYIGEVMGGRNSGDALRSGLGSLLGFLAGTFIKLVMTAVVTWHFIFP